MNSPVPCPANSCAANEKLANRDSYHDENKSVAAYGQKKEEAAQTRPIPIWPATKDRPLLPLSLDGLCYLSDIEEKDESFAIQKTLFLGFPGAIAGGRNAHHEAIGWCISRKAVIVNRDVFSAGGKKEIELVGASISLNLPGVITKAMTALNRKCPASLADLSEINGRKIKNIESAIECFKQGLCLMVFWMTFQHWLHVMEIYRWNIPKYC
jgi:hypothetical protein